MPSAADTALSSVDLPPVNLGTLGSPQSPTANDNGLSAVPSPLKQGGKANVGEKLASTDLIAKPPAALQPRPPAAAPPPSSYANRVVAIEGTGQNLLSSSNGTGGFLDPTWLAVTRGEPEVAGKTEQQILQMKVSDPVFATRMVEKYAKKNGDYLQANGLPVNDDTLYLAHFMGAEGARAVLTAPPDTPITAIKDRQGRPIGQIALAANPRLTGMTASSLIDFTASLMSGTHQGQDDPAIQRWQAETRADLDQSKTQFDRIMAEMEKQPPGSAERMQLLHQAMDRSKELADRFDKMSQVPPKPQSPFEAAGALTPLLIGLVSLVGLKSRQPALAAINATGAALGALKQGNDENYKDAVDLWSKQSQLAYKAFESQNHVIDNIYKDIELNERERQELLQNEFRTWGMNLQRQMAKEGQWPQVYKMHQAAMKLQSDLKEQNANTARAWATAWATPGKAGLERERFNETVRYHDILADKNTAKAASSADELEGYVTTIEELKAAITADPSLVGIKGAGRDLLQRTAGQFGGDHDEAIEAFRTKMQTLQSNLVRPFLEAHYFTGIGAERIEEIVKGLGRLSDPTSAIQSLTEVQNRLKQQIGGIRGAVQSVKQSSSAQPPPPAVGTVEEGMWFKGGDAADPSNWEKVEEPPE